MKFAFANVIAGRLLLLPLWWDASLNSLDRLRLVLKRQSETTVSNIQRAYLLFFKWNSTLMINQTLKTTLSDKSFRLHLHLCNTQALQVNKILTCSKKVIFTRLINIFQIQFYCALLVWSQQKNFFFFYFMHKQKKSKLLAEQIWLCHWLD